MSRRRYWFTQELDGEVYARLVWLGAQFSVRALLVVRPNLGLSDRGQGLLERLQPWLLSTQIVTEWPGTKLHENETAELLSYDLTAECVAVISEAAEHLSGWMQPALPEDLSFVRQDGDPWLVSIAHEGEAYLSLSEQEYSRLVQEAPTVAELLQSE